MCATFSSYLFNPITTFLPLFSRKRHAWAFWKFDLDFAKVAGAAVLTTNFLRCKAIVGGRLER